MWDERISNLYFWREREITQSDEGACNKVAEECQRGPAFRYVDTNNDGIDDAWCHGKFGCALACQNEGVAYTGSSELAIEHNNHFNEEFMNERATTLARRSIVMAETSSTFPFNCGCKKGGGNLQQGTLCDADYDGYFNEVCDRGNCKAIQYGKSQKWCDGNHWYHSNLLGTDLDAEGECAQNKYCSNGDCHPDKCDQEPFKLLRFAETAGKKEERH